MIERIGSYRVLGEVGAGGMAVVYKAVQEPLQRLVAIKALKSSVAADSHFAIRFEREALSIAALQHENITHIYDFQRQGDAAFIVMEFVEGIDLFDLLDRSPVLPVDVAAIIATQVARALDYAHYRGIIHRDIKPANVMVAKSGGVKLTDFGIARDQAFGDLTKDGTGLGTPSYMSPEQILGDKLDFRSDVFSLGIVLYQMLCGRKPFVEDEHRSVMAKIRLERPTSPRKLNPEVPRELEKIVYRCLEKRREDRFRSTQSLVIALERFLARRIEMNYRSRVVLYLRELGVIAEDEAERFLHPAIAGGYARADAKAALRGGGLRRLLAVEGGVLAAMALAAGYIHLAPIGPVRMGLASAKPPPRASFLQVVVDPWARVYVDGEYLDTTPMPMPLPVAAGHHRVELRNNLLRYVEAREVELVPGQTARIKAAVKR